MIAALAAYSIVILIIIIMSTKNGAGIYPFLLFLRTDETDGYGCHG